MMIHISILVFLQKEEDKISSVEYNNKISFFHQKSLDEVI